MCELRFWDSRIRGKLELYVNEELVMVIFTDKPVVYERIKCNGCISRKIESCQNEKSCDICIRGSHVIVALGDKCNHV